MGIFCLNKLSKLPRVVEFSTHMNDFRIHAVSSSFETNLSLLVSIFLTMAVSCFFASSGVIFENSFAAASEPV